jgi:hypothetical protein
MSRDTACYTLTFEPGDKHAIQLVENATPAHAGDMRYVRTVERKDGEEYSSVLYGECSANREHRTARAGRAERVGYRKNSTASYGTPTPRAYRTDLPA